ncbi:MAG: NAD-dependent epimerase/dehydratase family protein [Deltaproteobacteria bacterium]|nr:NAD-dependent epimerase/dehydratase family protein [Deltaproteobacteria bacterium]
MKSVLVTGAKGFIGKNLIVSLKRKGDVDVIEYDLDSLAGLLEEGLAKADVIYHLAGVNRPERVEEFTEGNFDLTRQVCDALRQLGRTPLLVLSSSTQAALDNPYGLSKRQAEEAVFDFGRETEASVFVFRLHGVFGKWCRPNYNSVVATFCHNIARDLPVAISDPSREIELVYVDDVVRAFIGVMDGRLPVSDGKYCLAEPTYRISLGALAETIQGFRDSRVSLSLPDMNDPFLRVLYATYISYLPVDSFAYALTQRADPRGELAELLKSPHIGQIFVSRTRPGITRGHHYHDTKVEKFVVLEGDAVIRFRHILGGDVIEYPVSGREFRVVDIPPGYTHSIENIGQNDLIVLFWAAEIFDPNIPDAFGMPL